MRSAFAVCLACACGCGLTFVGAAETTGEPDVSGGSEASSSVDGAPTTTDGAALPDDVAAPDAAPLETSAPQALTHGRATSPANVDLTAEGTLDWIHWGTGPSPTYANRKAGVSPPIVSDWVVSGSQPQSISPSSNNPSAFAWSDGAPETSEGGSNTHVFFKGATNATVQILVATSPSPRTAQFYLALNRTRARFEVDFDDGSMPVSSEEHERNDGARAFVFTVQFRHASPSARLRVRWTMLTIVDPANSTVRVAAVTVK